MKSINMPLIRGCFDIQFSFRDPEYFILFYMIVETIF